MLSRQPAGRQRDHHERGSVAVFTAVFALAVIFLVALLVDGGSELNARERAADIAEQAARAAATDLVPASLRNGPPVIDFTTACTYATQAAQAYAQDFGSGASLGSTTCAEGANPQSVAVTVQVTTQPVIPVPGFTTLNVTVTQTATLTCGNADQQEAC
jgi:Flp pilus assembly protein TadG